VKMKVGNANSFSDKVDLNSIVKSGNAKYDYKIEPRKGYKLVTFNISR
jgi:hypothetical protein